MVGFLLFFMFMIPFLMFDFWVIFQYFFMFLFYIFIFNNCGFFFGSLSYIFGVDFFSYWLVVLSISIFMMIFLTFSFMRYNSFFNLLMINTMFLLFCLFILFFVLNIFLMYVFFELSLFPLIIYIFGWGYQPDRLISSIYLFFYTLFASMPLFILIIFLYNYNLTLYFDVCYYFSLNFFLYIFFILAFLVKLPIYVFHFWLPRAHVQAPVFGSMVLAGILLKIGGYGLIRFSFLIESLYYFYSLYMFSFCLVGCLIVSLICLVQSDFKSMIAYSSVVHMSMFLIGFLSMSSFGLVGSFFMMLSHGLCSSGLFFLCNIYYSRILSRSFYLIKGMVFFIPSLSIFLFILCIFNMGCPPSLNFFSELMIFMSSIMYFNMSFIYLLFISFFCACFCFYMFSYSQHGLFLSLFSFSSVYCCEFLILIFHCFPLFLLILNFNIFF